MIESTRAMDEGVVITALRDEAGVMDRIAEGRGLGALIRQCLLWCAVGAAVFGVALGSYAWSPPQIVASALKMPLLLLGATALCFPSFHVLQTLRATRPMTLPQAAALQANALTATALVWATFSLPLFFLVATTHHYKLAQLLALAVGACGGTVGYARLLAGYRRLCEPEARRRIGLSMLLYFLVYGVVGAQLAWVLRPFIGSPSMGFQVFRQLESNIFATVLRLLAG